ncbi:MAG: hypothetical protein RBT16_10330 [Desulfococcus multivorans]|jgi:hypothetical protein|nr:hypothetical protein [Desulfococcus multivorans]
MNIPCKTALPLFIAILLLLAHCSGKSGAEGLVGTWELEGRACGASGECGKEIIVDGGAGETFTAEGLYLSRRSRSTYLVEDGRIYLGGSGSERGDLRGEIVSIRGATMLLKTGNEIMRYRRRDSAQ